MKLKLGKLPARPGAVRFALATYAPTLPTPPGKFTSHAALVTDWGMLANDRYGSCVFAGAGHETMLWNREASRAVPFTDSAVLSDYSAVTGFNPEDPGTDQGTDMAVAASYRRKTGVIDAAGARHLVAAYLAITPGDMLALKQAVYRFAAVGVGVRFPASAMDQFNAGKPWSIRSSSPIEGGHYVPAVGYDSRYIYVVTWGRVQRMTWGFYRRYCDEALAYLSVEMMTGDLSPEGFNLAHLQADLAALPAA